ncbi:MAG: PD40 domain-containing protein, partial [Rubrobacter sp.]|nr:PD40 domain-containing protein [Rubrobacter sp.]
MIAMLVVLAPAAWSQQPDEAQSSDHVSVKHDDKVNAVAFSPDSKYLATASSDKTACVWEAATGDEVKCVSHKGPVNSVAFSPKDGKYIATASDDGTARIWNATTGKEETSSSPIKPGGKKAYGVAFSSDGKHLATASDDGNPRIWDTSNGQEESSSSP